MQKYLILDFAEDFGNNKLSIIQYGLINEWFLKNYNTRDKSLNFGKEGWKYEVNSKAVIYLKVLNKFNANLHLLSTECKLSNLVFYERLINWHYWIVKDVVINVYAFEYVICFYIHANNIFCILYESK